MNIELQTLCLLHKFTLFIKDERCPWTDTVGILGDARKLAHKLVNVLLCQVNSWQVIAQLLHLLQRFFFEAFKDNWNGILRFLD